MVKYSRKFRGVQKSIWIALAFLLVFGFLLQNVAGSVYYSLSMDSGTAVLSPPVILREGTAGNSTINTNGTSAKVSVEPSGDFNYVLNMTENHGANWKVRLTAYDQSNITRLDNCSIYIYDGSNSTQIVIIDGNYSQQSGLWYDLNASDTEYIWMHVETSSSGTSYVYAYLEIKVPDKTVYAQYVITFEIIN